MANLGHKYIDIIWFALNTIINQQIPLKEALKVGLKQYLIVAKSEASAIIRPPERLEVDLGAGYKAVFFTLYSNVGFEVPVPKGIRVEISGSAPSIKGAIEKSANKAQGILGAMGLCVNAYLGRIEIELAYENGLGIPKRDYFQSFVPEQPLEAVPGRIINLQCTGEFITAIDKHPHKNRLTRAIAQYYEALRNWSLGNEVTCVEHIFIGIETIKNVALENHLKVTGLTKEKLADNWGFHKRSQDPRENRLCRFLSQFNKTQQKIQNINAFLESEARRRLIFKGDKSCSKLAKIVSDGFEHGYEEFHRLRTLASQVTRTSAKYLRECIIKQSGISKETQNCLLSFDMPRGPLKIIKYLWGFLIADNDLLAAPGQKYPFCEWTSRISQVKMTEEGVYSFSPIEDFKAILGSGVTLTPERVEIWDGSTIKEVSKPQGKG